MSHTFRYHKYFLTEAEIRYSMRHSSSVEEAARFLHISNVTWKKYAEKYIDHETGLNLHQLQKNQSGKGIRKKVTRLKPINLVAMEDIFANKHPNYRIEKLRSRLIEDEIFMEACTICGFNEKRLSDGLTPIILVFKNGNKKDMRLENLEFVCPNHYFLYYGNMIPRPYLNMSENDPFYTPDDLRANEYYDPDDEIDFSQY